MREAFQKDLLQTCKPNALLIFYFARPAISYYYLPFQTTLQAFVSLWLCKEAGVGKFYSSSFICTWQCKSSCTFHHHTAMYQLDPSKIFESWQASVVFSSTTYRKEYLFLHRKEKNSSVNSQFISEKRKKVKNILVSYLFKIIFTIHEKAAAVNKIVSGKQIHASQKSVCSNASCFYHLN